MNAQIKAALRSLPWYIVFGYLFGPLILAPFTGGASLIIYAAPFMPFVGKGDGLDVGIALLCFFGPGLAFWILRQFWRFAFFSWKERHLPVQN